MKTPCASCVILLSPPPRAKRIILHSKKLYYLEYDTKRAGGFEPLLHLPAHKNVILGVITAKFPELEDKEKMKERVFAAAKVVAKGAGQAKEQALKRLGVSPQCGFASHEEGNLLGWEDMKNKLALVRSIANDIWPGEP
jgi:methionine synthase II (cobalamin-independent)